MFRRHPLIPTLAIIKEVHDETPDVKNFKLKLAAGGPIDSEPGQFIMLSVFGYGEAPFSISSPPRRGHELQVAVKKVGRLTEKIHKLRVGDVVGVRGPFGKGFQMEEAYNHNVTIVVEDVYIACVRTLIEALIQERRFKGGLTILYGASGPASLVYKEDLARWSGLGKVETYLTIDKAVDGWKGYVGPLQNLLNAARISSLNSKVIISGSTLTTYLTIKQCLELGVKPGNIYIHLQRRVVCGIGKCGHCGVGAYRVCIDGPFFNYTLLEREREWLLHQQAAKTM